jgi:hypothetical protein
MSLAEGNRLVISIFWKAEAAARILPVSVA